MIKHWHRIDDPMSELPYKLLIWYDGDYYVGYFTGTYVDCGQGIVFVEDDDFCWYDLTELEG